MFGALNFCQIFPEHSVLHEKNKTETNSLFRVNSHKSSGMKSIFKITVYYLNILLWISTACYHTGQTAGYL